MTVDQKLKRSRSKSEPMIKTQVSDDVSKNGIPLDGTTSTDAPSDYSLDIEASRKHHTAAFFIFSNRFSLDRKIIMQDEKIDPDDVATSPLHESDLGRRGILSWTMPYENFTHEYFSSSNGYESDDTPDVLDKYSAIVPANQDMDIAIVSDSSVHEDDIQCGEIVPRMASERIVEDDNIKSNKSNKDPGPNSSEVKSMRKKALSLKRLLFGPKKIKSTKDVDTLSPEKLSDKENKTSGCDSNCSEMKDDTQEESIQSSSKRSVSFDSKRDVRCNVVVDEISMTGSCIDSPVQSIESSKKSEISRKDL